MTTRNKANIMACGLLALAFALEGCAVANKVDAETEKAKAVVGSEAGTLPGGASKDGGKMAPHVTDRPILGTQVVRPLLGQPLPAGMDTKRFGWQFDTNATLPDVAAKITEVTKLPVRVNDRRQTLGGGGAPAGSDTLINPANAATTFQAAYGGAGGQRAFPSVYLPSFDGTLPAFLQSLESRFDVTASVRDGGIVLDAFQVMTCDVPAPPTTSTISSEVMGATTGAATGPSGGTSAQSSQSTAKLDTFQDIKSFLEKTIAPSGAVYDVSPSLRRFTVVGSAETTRRARQYCDQLNDFLSTRIGVEVTIVEVTVNEGEDYGLNLEPVWRGAGLGVSVIGAAPQIANTVASGAISVLGPDEGGRSRHWAGSQAFIKAAATDGRLAQNRHTTALLQNGRSKTVNMTIRQDYIRNIINSPGTVANPSTTGTQTDTINYGYSLQLTAHATGNDEIQVSGSLTVSDLAGGVRESVGNGASVSLLTVPQRSIDIDVPLSNNETVAVSGNEHVRARRDRTGIINPAFFLLGGENRVELETTRVVVFLTAWRMKSTKPRQSVQ